MRAMLAAVAMLALSGCVTTDQPGESGIAEARGRFDAAAAAGDAAALGALYTADAAVMAPNLARIDGRDAIVAMWARFFEAGTTGISMTPTELDVRGDRATDVGVFALSGADGRGRGSPAGGRRG